LARQLRIEYPGAFYHVFSRGNRKQLIFFSDEDRCFFINCLRKACEKCSVVVHAYCLMPNHFHLVLETPMGNLSRMMHFLITSFTVYFNKKHERHGHLFQGRFRSVLVDAVGYAKELSRYIHLNPVRSGIVERPEQYAWSSYEYYRGKTNPEPWLETSLVLRLFDENLAAARGAYVEFVARGTGEKSVAPISESIRYGILGSEEFIARIRKEFLSNELDKHDRERPQLRKLMNRPDLSYVLAISEKALGPRNKLLVPIAIYLSQKSGAYKLREIGEFHSLSISGVANACKRARAAMLENAALIRAVKDIELELADMKE
jgi:putative transposase